MTIVYNLRAAKDVTDKVAEGELLEGLVLLEDGAERAELHRYCARWKQWGVTLVHASETTADHKRLMKITVKHRREDTASTWQQSSPYSTQRETPTHKRKPSLLDTWKHGDSLDNQELMGTSRKPSIPLSEF